MLELKFDISVGNYRFTTVTSIAVESSWKTPGATASIELPSLRGMLAKGKNAIKRGDAVVIKLGYNSTMVTEFEGYVTHISPNIPFKIDCEDAIYLLRKVDIKEGGITTLSQCLALVKKALPQIDIVQLKTVMSFEGLRLNYNAATLLQKMRDDYDLACYFRGNKLYVAKHDEIMSQVPGKIVRFDEGRNVISTSLEFKTAAERKIRFNVIGFDTKTKKRTELSIGDADEDAEVRPLLIGGANVALMKQKAEEMVKSFKYDGYDGSFLAFGLPIVQHSDLVEFHDLNFPERSGTYEVDTVKVSSGINGYRREITLGKGVIANA